MHRSIRLDHPTPLGRARRRVTGRALQRPLIGTLVAGLAAAALLGTDPLPALAAGTMLVNEAFTGSTTSSPHWVLPSAPSGTNSACLTAGTSSSQTPVPGCGLSSPDAGGSGALRFTTATTNLEGGVAYTLAVPTSYGVDATFDSYQYGGNGADGIGFFLAAANPSDPKAPTSIGQPGGALGYSVRTGSPGLTYGYLGVGIDVYGNYANTTYEGSGCTDPGWGKATTFPNNVSVRGPGNGTVGYCMLASTAGSGSTANSHSWTLEGGPSGTRSSSEVPVEVVINPSSSAVTSASGLSVPADSFEVAFTPLNNSNNQVVVTGSLPTTSNGGIPSGLYPAGYVDPTTGIPYQLTFGWVASTGGSTDIHEVNNVEAGTLSGTPPQLGASVSDNASQAPMHGSTMDYDVTVSNASGAVTEGDTVTLTDTVPAGETPLSAGLGGSGWTCSISGQTVTCTESSPLAAGSSYPVLTIPVTVTASGGTVIADTVAVSSDDASSGSGTDTVTVAKIPTSMTASAAPSTTTYGTSVSLSATGLPSAATGTVTFISGATTLCSQAVSSGSASCATGSLPVGAYPVTATYSGDSNYLSATASTSFAVNQAATSFTASASPSPTTYGTSVTLSATGLPSAATGTVTFTSGADHPLLPGGQRGCRLLPDRDGAAGHLSGHRHLLGRLQLHRVDGEHQFHGEPGVDVVRRLGDSLLHHLRDHRNPQGDRAALGGHRHRDLHLGRDHPLLRCGQLGRGLLRNRNARGRYLPGDGVLFGRHQLHGIDCLDQLHHQQGLDLAHSVGGPHQHDLRQPGHPEHLGAARGRHRHGDLHLGFDHPLLRCGQLGRRLLRDRHPAGGHLPGDGVLFRRHQLPGLDGGDDLHHRPGRDLLHRLSGTLDRQPTGPASPCRRPGFPPGQPVR